MESRRRVRVVIYGQVQGVGFRYSARTRGNALGLTGWVRNRPDRTVEAVAEGPERAIGTFVAWLQQGPPGSRVERIVVEDEAPVNEGGQFRIER